MDLSYDSFTKDKSITASAPVDSTIPTADLSYGSFVKSQSAPTKVAEVSPESKGIFSSIVGGAKILASDFSQALTRKSEPPITTPFTEKKSTVGGDIALTTINSYSASLKDAADRMNNWSTVAKDTHATALDKGVAAGEAGIGALTAFLAPITAAATGAEKVPVLGGIAKGINNIFGAIGTVGADVLEGSVQALPLSQDTKDKIMPLFKEIGALGAQIYAGKAGGDVFDKFAGKSKEVLTKISEGVKETAPVATDVPKIDLSYENFKVKQPTEAPQTPESASTAPITPKVENSPLAQEAQKYKSAEEFVKAQTPMYHGSPVELKSFHNKTGAFFTDNYPDATGFAGSPDNVYEGYLNFKNPLVIDAKGAKWDELNTKFGKSTQEVVGNAQKAGYDGVTFKNIVDNAMDTAGYGESTISYAFKPKDAFLNESQLTDFYNKVTKPAETLQKTAPSVPSDFVPPKLETTAPILGAPKPIEATGGEFTSRVFERMKAENPEVLTGDLTVQHTNLAQDAQKAVDLIAKDKQTAYEIAMGAKTSPEVTSTAVNIAMTEKALEDGNNALAARLIKNRSLEQTRRGQEIVAERGSVTDNSTAKYVKELVASRLDALGKTYLGDLKLKRVADKTKAIERIDKEVAKVEKQIKTKKLDTKSALALLDKLACV